MLKALNEKTSIKIRTSDPLKTEGRDPTSLALATRLKPELHQLFDEFLTEIDSIKNITPTKFRAIDIPANAQWKLIKNEREILSLSNSLASATWISFLSKSVLPIPAAKVISSVKDLSNAPIFDPLLSLIEIIERFDDYTFAARLVYQSDRMPKTSAREFCVVVQTNSLRPGKSVITMKSFSIPKCQPKPEIIRGEILMIGCLIEDSMDGNTTSVTYLSQIDPKVALPEEALRFIKATTFPTLRI